EIVEPDEPELDQVRADASTPHHLRAQRLFELVGLEETRGDEQLPEPDHLPQIYHATDTSLHRYTSWIALSSSTPSLNGRWNALRPAIRPMPPARLLITAVVTASRMSFSPDAPPELMSPMRPM